MSIEERNEALIRAIKECPEYPQLCRDVEKEIAPIVKSIMGLAKTLDEYLEKIRAQDATIRQLDDYLRWKHCLSECEVAITSGKLENEKFDRTTNIKIAGSLCLELDEKRREFQLLVHSRTDYGLSHGADFAFRPVFISDGNFCATSACGCKWKFVQEPIPSETFKSKSQFTLCIVHKNVNLNMHHWYLRRDLAEQHALLPSRPYDIESDRCLVGGNIIEP